MTDFIPYLQYLERASIPAALIVIALVLYYGGVVNAIANAVKARKQESDNDFNQVNNRTNSVRLQKLEEFQLKAETNHFHDLENVMERVSRLEVRVDKIAEDVAWVRGKLGNGHK